MTARFVIKPASPLDRRAATAAPVYPKRLTTLALGRLALAFALGLAACGGGGSHHGDTYQHATLAEEQCCEHLAGPARDQCLGTIVRVSDPAVATSSINQSTFACVQDHFACDASTGRATRESAQAQLDCIQDLQQ